MENSLSVRPIGLSQRLLSSITSVDKFQMLINTNVCYWICRHWRKRQNTYLFPISTKYCDVWCIIVLLYFSFQCLGGITYEIGKKRVIKLVEKSAKFRSMCENLIVTFFYLPFRFECLDTISGAKLSNFKRKLPQRKFCPKIQVIILYFLFRGQAPYCFAVYTVIIIYNNSNNCDIELWLPMPKWSQKWYIASACQVKSPYIAKNIWKRLDMVTFVGKVL